MGYCINMNISNLTIPLKHVDAALKAINALFKNQKTIKKNKGGGASTYRGVTIHSYSWVSNPPDGGFKNLEDAFRAWRYDVMNDDGGCVVHEFTGEKLGDCDVLWTALAPFVNPKAVIQVRGEDVAHWRWVFKGKKFKEQVGTIVWD